jgi:hypothetical protein
MNHKMRDAHNKRLYRDALIDAMLNNRPYCTLSMRKQHEI